MAGFNRIVNPRSSIGSVSPVVAGGLTVNQGPRSSTRLRDTGKRRMNRPPSLAEAINQSDDLHDPIAEALRRRANQLDQQKRIDENMLWQKQRAAGELPEQMSVDNRRNALEAQRANIAGTEAKTRGIDAATAQTQAQTEGIGIDNQSKQLQLEQAQGQKEYREKFFAMSDLADSIATIVPNKQGFHRLPNKVLQTLSRILPDFKTTRFNQQTGELSDIKAFGVVEPNDPDQPDSPLVFSLYQDDGTNGLPQRVMNKGAPVRIPVDTISAFAKIGKTMRMQAEGKANKDSQPAQVKLVEWIAKNLTDGDMEAAWKKSKEAVENPKELAAKLFLAEKKNLAAEYEYNPEEMPSDDAIMQSIMETLDTMNSYSAAGKSERTGRLTNPETGETGPAAAKKPEPQQPRGYLQGLYTGDAPVRSSRAQNRGVRSGRGKQKDPENMSQKRKAPQKAIDYLKAHPDTAEQFKAHYGYLPEGY